MTTPEPAAPPLARVVADADLSFPAQLPERFNIVVVPADAPRMLERMNIPRLIVEARTDFDPATVVAACRAAAEESGTVIYVPAGDGHGRPEGMGEEVRQAVEAVGGRLLISDVPETLMAGGWRAIVASEALAAGATPGEALQQASSAQTRLLALVEHPELAGHSSPGHLGVPNRVVAWMRGAEFALDSAPERRDEALRRLRDLFAEHATGTRGLRVAVLYGGVRPAAEAMGIWIERHVRPSEVHVGAITRHAATRLGPGFIGIAWTFED